MMILSALLIKVYKKKGDNGGGADRFIPNRSNADLELASHFLLNAEEDTNTLSSTQERKC